MYPLMLGSGVAFGSFWLVVQYLLIGVGLTVLLFFDVGMPCTWREGRFFEPKPLVNQAKTMNGINYLMIREGNFLRTCVESVTLITLIKQNLRTTDVKIGMRCDGCLHFGEQRHGVKQPRDPWSDGPEYITQCPIRPGSSFIYTVTFTNEEGTLWWHAHSDYTRATVHGAIVVYPGYGTSYPFPKPSGEVVIVLGEWWYRDVNELLKTAREIGADPSASDAFTINGQPGDLYPCSKQGVWFLHCHLECHLISGMDMVFIVKDGVDPKSKLLPPPPLMPPC